MDEIPWVIKEQTKIKHELLESYISPWMGILYSHQKRTRGLRQLLIYVEGFSGPGIYYENENKDSMCSGSPIIVAEKANEYIDLDRQRHFLMYCMDSNPECVNLLTEKLDKANKYKQDWKVYNAIFEEKIGDIIQDINRRGLSGYPIFFFLDPFGYTGYPINIIKKILEYERAEVFINFMIYDIVRFCKEEEYKEKLIEQFGCDDFIKAGAIENSEEKQAFLLNLYVKNLYEIANAEFVMPFRVNTPDMGTRPRFYLIHASNHLKALKTMKNEMYKLSESEYSFEAIGVSSQLTLFEDPNKVELKDALLAYIKDRNPQYIPYTEIENWAYAKTSGVSRTIKDTLVELEQQDKKIEIKRKPRQRTTTVTPGAKIKYLGDAD